MVVERERAQWQDGVSTSTQAQHRWPSQRADRESVRLERMPHSGSAKTGSQSSRHQTYSYQPLTTTPPDASISRTSSPEDPLLPPDEIKTGSYLGDHGSPIPTPIPLHGADVVQAKPRRTWRSSLWDTLDKDPAERRFLAKLDTVVLTFASLGYFIKYLDSVNVNSAFVSGMQEDLGLYGNELNYISACWTVGYVLGQIPSNLILARIRPSRWIPACEVVWALLTVLMARCSTMGELCLLRFFIGLAESTFYPGMQYIIGSWYRSDELAKRSCIFHAAGGLGSMASGLLMAAVYPLGRHYQLTGEGLRGWQWLFVVDGAISLPIGIAGFFFLPDVPEITRAWYFSPDEIAIAQRRMVLEGRAPRAPLTRAKVHRILHSWHLSLLTALYVFFNNGGGFGGQPAFQLWLKSKGYPVSAINLYPTLTSIVNVVTTFSYAWSSDTIFRGARWPPILFVGVVNIVAYGSLAIWAIPDAWKWTCFFLSACSGGISGLIFAWAHEICRHDSEERALVTGSMNQMAYVFQAWLPLLLWQQIDAPYYQKGFISNVVISVFLIVAAFVVRHLHVRELCESSKAVEIEEDELVYA